jgi:hypothetical protein
MTPSIDSETNNKNSTATITPILWDEIHDALTLALDALGDRPEEFCGGFFRSCMAQVMDAINQDHGDSKRGHSFPAA